jgi:hypothetical protein
VIGIVLSVATGAPFMVPTERISRAIGVHYIVPFSLGVLGYLLVEILVYVFRAGDPNNRQRLRDMATDGYFLALFIVVMYVHFHIKMWMPLINPRLFDYAYFSIDNELRSLLDIARVVRDFVARLLPAADAWYQNGFLAMFALSLWFHAIGSRRWHFHNMTALLQLEMIGAISYLIVPAVGPFIFEVGPNALATRAQHGMYLGFTYVQLEGIQWLARNGGEYFTGPPAAMPSLHIAGAWIMTYYAVKARSLVAPVMIFLFAWICIESVVARWHYIIDLPAGLALATLIIVIANRVCRHRHAAIQP